MISTKLFTTRLFNHRQGISWSNLKLHLVKQSAAGFSSNEQSDNLTTSHLDVYTQNKMHSHRSITQSLLEESLEKEEEKYQNKLSSIIEIIYSMDESFRPKNVTPVDIDYMVKMEKPMSIRNYLKRLAKTEASNKSTAEYKQEVREAILAQPKPECGVVFDNETGAPVYKVHAINLICSWAITKRIRSRRYARIAQTKLLDAPKVVIDFDYDQHMTVKQHMTITAQVRQCIGNMRDLEEPVNLYFCNLKPESPVARYLELDFGSLSSHMVEVTSKSYLDLFPKEKLVYLTADTENVLKYDPDDIYIIGGMIDTLTNEPLSALKSRREGLRTAKLPLNEHFQIRNEVKSLKIGQVFGIICGLSSSRKIDLKTLLEKYIPHRIQTDEETDLFMEKYEKDFAKSGRILKNKFLLTDEETEIMLLLALYYGQRRR